SREAIVQAEADRVVEVEPIPWTRRVLIIAAGVAALVVVIAGVLWGLRKRTEEKQDNAMKLALQFVSPDPKSKKPALKREMGGLVRLLAGRHELARNNSKEAKDHLVAARSALDQSGNNTPER